MIPNNSLFRSALLAFSTISVCLASPVRDATSNNVLLAPASKPVVLADGGRALQPITIAPGSSDVMCENAAQLAGFLKRITEADFKVIESNEPGGITLGTIAEFGDPELADALSIRGYYDGVEAYCIRADDNGVRLIGNNDLGVRHAVFHFLETLGCRWFFPGPAWELVPNAGKLEYAVNLDARPDILSRDIWIGRHTQADQDEKSALTLWNRGNRMGDSLKVKILHRWHAIPEDFPDEFAAHPEYFALVDGKRTPPQFCVTNPGLQKIIIQFAQDHFKKHPDDDMVSLDPADQPGWCTCEECKKLGHYTNQPFFLANIAARELQKSNPGKYVGLLAYSWYSDPPDFPLEPNIYVQLTAGMNFSELTFDELFELWSEKGKNLGIYEYYSYWEMDKSMFPGRSRVGNFEDLQQRIPRFVANHVDSISAQAANNWGVNGLGYYLASRLMWDSSTDITNLRREFYQMGFGPAAENIERYFERLNRANKPLEGMGLIAQSALDLEKAKAAAKGQPDILRRIDHLRENLIFNHLGRLVENAPNEAAEKAATLDWFTWAFRTRNNYMNDWITFRSSLGRPASEKFGEPDWFWRNTLKNPEASPWYVQDPVTSEELDEKIASILDQIGPLPQIVPVEFSEDYVLARIDTSLKSSPSPRRVLFTGEASYLVASMEGDPLRITASKRPTGHLVTPAVKYRLTTQSGELLKSGEFGFGDNLLEIPVPGPGIYRFTANRTGHGWEIEFPADMPHALEFQPGERIRPAGITDSYIYIPQGTKDLVWYAASSSIPKISNPAGEVVFDSRVDGSFLSLPISGADGTSWRFSGKPHHLWFFNVPTLLSSDPDLVFVPVSVAKADDLDIVIR